MVLLRECYFRYTLQTLKELELETFPMCKFIVQGSSEVEPPQYLSTAQHMIQVRLQEGHDTHFSPLLKEHWPSHDALGLDENQYEAFKAALTTQFAIIQGPPGTGKTYLGLRIAEVLLTNEHIWKRIGSTDGPIFVVCYTNHALDQFLEGVLKILENGSQKELEASAIIRVGGRSQSEKLQKYTLANVLRNRSLNNKMPKHYWASRHEVMSNIDDLRYQRSSVMAALMGLRDVQGR
jgi:hypothetical protein